MKNIILKKMILPALALSLALPAYSAEDSLGTGGSAFLKIPAGSARVQGLGNNGVSLVEGTDAININPAGIAVSQMREFNFSYISWFQGYSGKYISYVEPIGQSVVGFNLSYFNIEGFDARDSGGIQQYSDDIKVRHGYASLILAKSFFLERLSLGLGIKGVLEDNYTTQKKNIVYDAGALLKLSRKLSVAWASQNMSGSKEEIVQITRFGFTWKFNPFLTLTLDQKKYTDAESKVGFGIEFNLPEELLQVGKITFRTGYTDTANYGRNYDDKTLDKLGLSDTSGWSFGFGIYSAQAFGNIYSLDYSMVPFGALGKSTQMTLKFQF